MENPKCFKCDANSSSFLVWRHATGEGTLILVFCNECGAVRGIVRE